MLDNLNKIIMKTPYWMSVVIAPFVLASCEPEKPTTREQMDAGAEKIQEGLKEMAKAASEKTDQSIEAAREATKEAVEDARVQTGELLEEARQKIVPPESKPE